MGQPGPQRRDGGPGTDDRQQQYADPNAIAVGVPVQQGDSRPRQQQEVKASSARQRNPISS